MIKKTFWRCVLCVFCCLFVFSGITVNAESWDAEWENPSAKNRPLQIVHGGIPAHEITGQLPFMKNVCGLGGIVCNVARANYLKGETEWKTLIDTVAEAKRLGLRVWIYDEDGYPSPAAGGLVLEGHPEFEAQELAYDAEREKNGEDPFLVRDCFEFTHATNNYCAVRRYPNVLNDAAMERFLDVTHRQYAQRLKVAGVWDVVEAFFTDEPSTNAFNTGVIPNLKVRTQDEPNTEKKNLPTVVWSDDFPAVYREMYGEELLPVRKSLFTGDTAEDRKVRVQFWEMVSTLYNDRFMAKIQKWCESEGKASSGHALHEENLAYHTPGYGNVFSGTKTMHIAGMDFLNNMRHIGLYGWRTAVYPASVNIMNGQRLMMTEISDHHEVLSLKRTATLSEMTLTAAWQMIHGCTEFTLYYGIWTRGHEVHRKYCDYVGRMNAILRDADVVKRAVIYYPARDLQEEYLPIAERLTIDSQSPRMQKIIHSYYALGEMLTVNQVPFFVADAEMLQSAKIAPNRVSERAALQFGNQSQVEMVVVPAGVQLPEETRKMLDDFRNAGGTVLMPEETENAEKLATFRENLPPRFTTDAKLVLVGEFARDGYRIFVLANMAENEFQSSMNVGKNVTSVLILDPLTGEKKSETVKDERVSVNLPPAEARIYLVK
ncbi:MAG: hypothetical protein Q4C70_03245 [Planctomycetia bacterium]|nr:hypothetical protein [Planctomycetia bacterium]